MIRYAFRDDQKGCVAGPHQRIVAVPALDDAGGAGVADTFVGTEAQPNAGSLLVKQRVIANGVPGPQFPLCMAHAAPPALEMDVLTSFTRDDPILRDFTRSRIGPMRTGGYKAIQFS